MPASPNVNLQQTSKFPAVSTRVITPRVAFKSFTTPMTNAEGMKAIYPD